MNLGKKTYVFILISDKNECVLVTMTFEVKSGLLEHHGTKSAYGMVLNA